VAFSWRMCPEPYSGVGSDSDRFNAVGPGYRKADWFNYGTNECPIPASPIHHSSSCLLLLAFDVRKLRRRHVVRCALRGSVNTAVFAAFCMPWAQRDSPKSAVDCHGGFMLASTVDSDCPVGKGGVSYPAYLFY